MGKVNKREINRQFRHQRIRKKSHGTAERPRLCLHRSHKNLFAQIIDDSKNNTLIGMSTVSKGLRDKVKFGGNISAATELGTLLSSKAQEKGIRKVCFDRGGYLYHGRIKAFAEAARKEGLEF